MKIIIFLAAAVVLFPLLASALVVLALPYSVQIIGVQEGWGVVQVVAGMPAK